MLATNVITFSNLCGMKKATPGNLFDLMYEFSLHPISHHTHSHHTNHKHVKVVVLDNEDECHHGLSWLEQDLSSVLPNCFLSPLSSNKGLHPILQKKALPFPHPLHHHCGHEFLTSYSLFTVQCKRKLHLIYQSVISNCL